MLDTVNSPFPLERTGYNSRFTFGKREDHHMVLGISLVQKFAALTGCSDQEVARMLGISRSTVQAYRSGRLAENLDEQQREKIVRAAQNFRQQIYEAVAEMEMLS